MRRAIIAIVILGLGAGMAAWLYWMLGTCRLLDRHLGLSGCKASIHVTDFGPLFRNMMVAPQGEDTLSLFGEVRTADGWKAGLVRVALPNGEEKARHPIAMAHVMHAKASSDGTRVFLSCGGKYCNEIGKEALIASTLDGRTISVLERVDRFPRGFPGEPQPPEILSRRAVLIPGGQLAVDVEETSRQIVIRNVADGAVIRAFEEGAPRGRYDEVPFLVPSPDGKLIAGLDIHPPPRLGFGAVIYIWDVENGRLIASIQTDPDHKLLNALVWSWDAKHIFVARNARSGVQTSVYVFGWEGKGF